MIVLIFTPRATSRGTHQFKINNLISNKCFGLLPVPIHAHTGLEKFAGHLPAQRLHLLVGMKEICTPKSHPLQFSHLLYSFVFYQVQ